ncbi:MAG: HPr kinase/phosphatase C-terminal domain-containing protein [Rhodospirillales bacterium]|nr:HPr kinase/phosphatase C-terminal domain-containing protein [Rhodospirillales bacterium]MBN8901751.1 HPr kinase/phosphatase C-terminal domain-containing protein [Rhodospirillales bacterium]MBN8907414.1 HPr kinase/phosphatase C-terminal domain-containing protein [Rhodospirillales bacterium]
MHDRQRVHGSCASRGGDAVLILGPSGSGKSDLVVRLLARGFSLVADDQVDVTDGMASPPVPLAGLLEVRGLGILRLPATHPARLRLVIELGDRPDRLPAPATHPVFGLPLLRLDPAAPSAPERVALALDCAIGRVTQVAGAFAA